MAPRAKKKCAPTAADRYCTAVEQMTGMGFEKKDVEATIEALLKVYTKVFGGWDFLELDRYSVIVDALLNPPALLEPSGNAEGGGPSSSCRVKAKGLVLRTPMLRKRASPGAGVAASGKGKAAVTPAAAKKNMEKAIKGKRPIGKDSSSETSDGDSSSDEESPLLIRRRVRTHAQGRIVERDEDDVEEVQPCSPPVAEPPPPSKRPAEPDLRQQPSSPVTQQRKRPAEESDLRQQPSSPGTQQRNRPAAEPEMQPAEQQQSAFRKRRAEPEPEPKQIPEPEQVQEPKLAATGASEVGVDKNLRTLASVAVGMNPPAQVGGWVPYTGTPPISTPRRPRIGGNAAASSPYGASTSDSGGSLLTEFEVKKEVDEVVTAGCPSALLNLNIKAEPDTHDQPVATRAATLANNAGPTPLQQVHLEVQSEVRPLASIPAVPFSTERANTIFNPDAVVEREKSIFLRGLPQGTSEFGIRELQEMVKKMVKEELAAVGSAIVFAAGQP